MTESQLTKYFRQQVEGTEASWDAMSLRDRISTVRSLGKITTPEDEVGFKHVINGTPADDNEEQNIFHIDAGDIAGTDWFEMKGVFKQALQRKGVTEARASPIDKFENSFNPGIKCAHCGMSRKQHGKGQMDHPFETRKQVRDKFQAKLKQTEIRADDLLNQFQKQFGTDAPQDAEGALDFLTRMGISRDEAVRTIQASGGAIELRGTEAIPEKQHWDNLQTSARQVLGSQLDIDPLPYDQLTPAEKGTLGVWWDENKARERAVSNPKDFTHRKPLIKTKQIGQTPPEKTSVSFPESFYNYEGAETLDSRAEERTAEEQSDDEVRSWWEQLAPQRRTGVIDGSSQLRFNELGPSAKQVVKLAFLRKPIPDSLMMKALNGEIKKPIGALSPKKISRLRSKMTPEEREDADEFHQYETVKAVGNEGQKFTVKQEGTMLPKGNYEVLSKKTDQAHSGPWGTFSITTVKNLDTGERHEIPTGNAQLIYGIN